MTRPPAEVEPEIAAARQALAHDVEALRAKAAPRELMAEARAAARSRVRRGGARVLAAAGATPLPAAVAGWAVAAAAGWLLARRLGALRREPVVLARLR